MSDGGKNKQKSKFINLDIEFLGFSEMTDPPDSLRTSLKMTLHSLSQVVLKEFRLFKYLAQNILFYPDDITFPPIDSSKTFQELNMQNGQKIIFCLAPLNVKVESNQFPQNKKMSISNLQEELTKHSFEKAITMDFPQMDQEPELQNKDFNKKMEQEQNNIKRKLPEDFLDVKETIKEKKGKDQEISNPHINKTLLKEIENLKEEFKFEFMNLSTITYEKQATNQLIYVTKTRKAFLTHLFQPLEKEIRENLTFLPASNSPFIDPNKLRFLLLGNEGIGKTFTLGLLTFVLKTSSVKDKIKVFYIQNCQLFSENPNLSIQDEFNQFSSGANLGNLEEPAEFTRFYSLVDDYNNEGFLTVFIADQLNSIDKNSVVLFLKLLTLPWKMQIYSQSATNINNEDFKNVFKSSIYCTCEKFFTKEKIESLITDQNKENNNLNLEPGDFQEIYSLVKENPRETELILKSKGNTVKEKIETYKFNRGKEIYEISKKFYNINSFNIQSELNKSIYFMDTDCFFESMGDPSINNQFMKFSSKIISDPDLKRVYQIHSSFPFAGYVLKKHNYYKKDDCDFFDAIKQQLKESLLKEEDGRVIGCHYEQLIHTIFENFAYNIQKGKICISKPGQIPLQDLKQSLIDFNLEKFFEFDKYADIRIYIENPLYKNKNLYFKPTCKTQKAVDSLIYFQKPNSALAKFLGIQNINSEILVSFQIKKNVKLVFDKLLEIKKKWEEERKIIEKEIPEVPHFLFLMTRRGVSNHKMQSTIEDNIYFIFTDVNRENTLFNTML